MVAVCPHCSRTNTAEARFCYYDGASLFGQGAAVPVGAQSFPSAFVFPSGVKSRNFDEFAQNCEQCWDEAAEILRSGDLQPFFGGIGRMDLVQAAREAAAFPDRDRGLDLLIARLPGEGLPPPQLDIQPSTVNVGALKMGQTGQFQLQLENKGGRLLFGSISSTCKWLAVTDTGAAKLFQFRRKSALTISIKGQHLRAGITPLEAKLLVETNAGTFQVKVVAQVPIQPYPDGVLAGARTPRELAEKAKTAPKTAAPLFESGAVANWYQSNGWTYPVRGPAASGLAAVQQYFEALGLSKAPKVHVLQPQLALQGIPGTRCSIQIQLRSEENRPIYAHGACRDPWLMVKPALLHGTTATLPLEIAVPVRPGALLQTVVKIYANGNQAFDVPVQLTVGNAVAPLTGAVAQSPNTGITSALSAKAPLTGAPTKAPVPAAPEFAFANPGTAAKLVPGAGSSPTAAASTAAAAPPIDSGGVSLHMVPVVLLLLVLCGLIGYDAITDNPRPKLVEVKEELAQGERVNLANAPQFKVAVQDEPDILPEFAPAVRFTIKDEREERIEQAPLPVKVAIKDEPAEKNGPKLNTTPLVSYQVSSPPKFFGMMTTAAAGAAKSKKLTFAADGNSNSTVASINGATAAFGLTPGPGVWTRQNKPLNGIAPTPGGVRPSHSTWVWNGVEFHQVLEIVPGQPVMVGGAARRQLDSVLVRWVIRNQSKAARSVGLRLLLDTMIGGNDGVPFTIPGKTGLVDTLADFRDARDVPDFIQALEVGSLRNPGTVAHLTLKVGGQLEPPGRVSLTKWPSFTFYKWEVPVAPMGKDSAVIMYWPEKLLKAGGTRSIGFSYGLGNVTANDKLGVTLGGSFEPGKHFTVTAYVENPIAGQTVRLELPDGLRRLEGAETQNVAAGEATSLVTWKVQVERPGEFRLKVVSSTGLSQAKTISIVQENWGKLTLDLQGSFEPGQTFTVLGKVNEPGDKQTLTLHLPKEGLERADGAETQPVPAPPAGSKDAVVKWQVRVKEQGTFPVRVSSNSGVAQTKTITIERPGRAEGLFQIVLAGDFTPGKIFAVSTAVATPAPDQKLTLILPTGLEREDGAETLVVKAAEPIVWKVKIKEVGKYLVSVKSTTGVTQRKTLIIEPPSEQGGGFTFDLVDEIRPGKEFRVLAKVTNPLPGQTLKLVLKNGLELAAGAEQQNVAMPAAKGETSSVIWSVRVRAPGVLSVSIVSSTGLTRTKTIKLDAPNSALFNQ